MSAENQGQASAKNNKAFALTASGLVAICSLFTGYVLGPWVTISASMFAALEVELPSTTRFVIAHSWLLPIVFFGAAIIVIAKDLLLCDLYRMLATTLITFTLVVASAGIVAYALYLPLFELGKTLIQAK